MDDPDVFNWKPPFTKRARSGRIEWTAIVRFYEQLNRVSPTVGRQAASTWVTGEVA
jgi:hypothetical protein